MLVSLEVSTPKEGTHTHTTPHSTLAPGSSATGSGAAVADRSVRSRQTSREAIAAAGRPGGGGGAPQGGRRATGGPRVGESRSREAAARLRRSVRSRSAQVAQVSVRVH